jgi:hypothetical protein
MTLIETIQSIELVAANQPTIASIVRNDVFRLNSFPDAKYSVFAWLQGEHRTALDSDLLQYSFTFFYVDRLTFDKGNEVEIQSVGIETLENILRTLEAYGIVAGEHTFRTFNQRFADECAGVYCAVTLEVPKDTMCEDLFEDYNRDFNEDFKIY